MDISPRWLDEREARAWRGYTRMRAQVHSRIARGLLASSGLSDADYAVLVNLSEAPGGRLRAYELGEAVQWEKSRLSHQLTRMTKRGLVSREECATDARGSFVVITEQGRSSIEAAAPAHVEDVRRYLLDALSPEQLVALGDIAEAVLAHLEGAPSEVCDDDVDRVLPAETA